MSRPTSLNSRVLTVLLLVALPVLLIGAGTVLGVGQGRLREAQTAELRQVASHTAAAVDAYVYRRILDAALLGRVPDLRRAAADGNEQPFDQSRVAELDSQWIADGAATAARLGILTTPASQFLADLVAHDSAYREVLVTDRYGRLVAASGITSDYYQADEGWWYQAWDNGRGRVRVSDVGRDESAQVYAFEIAVPVPAPGGDGAAGVMKIVADSRETLAAIAGLEVGATAEAMLVRPDGSIVFRRRPHAPHDRFFAADLLRQGVADRAEALAAPDAWSYEARSPEGSLRVVAVAPSQLAQSFPELRWLTVVSVERDELRAPFRSLVWYLVLVVLLTAVAVLAMALWLSLRLSEPPVDPAYNMHLVEHPPIHRVGEP
ncbi:hypothetical protein BH23ACI1_BH23ACI1_19360 [soil metagenome]